MGNQDLVLRILASRASAYAALADGTHALDDYHRGAEIIETLRNGLTESEYKFGFASKSKNRVYHWLVLIAQQHFKQAIEAWQWAERAKGRAFLDQLGNCVAIAPRCASPEWIRHERALLSELTRTEIHLRQARSDDERRRSLADIHSVRSKIEELLKKIEPEDLAYIDLRQGKPISFQQLKQLLCDR